MHIISLSYLLLATCLSVVEVDSTSVETKWPQYIFQPRFETALDGLKKRVQGKKDELWHVLEKIQKIEFLSKLFELKVGKLKEHFKDLKLSPYECPAENATLHEPTNMCYLLVKENKPWKDARQDCLLRGGDLAQPMFTDEQLLAILAKLIGKSDAPIYVGAIYEDDGEGNAEYRFLNGLIVPKFLVNTLSYPLTTPKRTLTAHVDRGQANATLYLREADTKDFNMYFCEFMATLKSPTIDLKEIVNEKYFVDYLPNEEDVEKEMPLVDCMSEEHFAIGTKCYKYFVDCDTCENAAKKCKEDGGTLAKVDLAPKSRFGGVLADIIRKENVSIDVIYPVWIEGKNDGSERFLKDPSGIISPLCPFVNRSTESTAPKAPQCMALLVPNPTPEIVSDNNVWNVALIKEATRVLLPFLCEYGALHKIYK